MSSHTKLQQPPAHRSLCWGRRLKDLLITLVLWGYFTMGFVVFFAPLYLVVFIFSKNTRPAYQYLNSLFYKGFFSLCRFIIPRHKWDIADDIRAIRSSIVVCNHLSYLDSILLVSLFPRHTTIAKAGLFNIPLFGRMMALSGYIPSSGHGRYADLLINSFDMMEAHLRAGGNIIIFPEGTRSRAGQAGTLNKGAFKIARKFNAPINALKVHNTDKLFTPGKFLFNTCDPNIIRVELIADLHPDYTHPDFSIKKLMDEVRDLIC